MKEFENKMASEDAKLKREEIVSAEDVLTDELAEEIAGGASSICLKGCTGGDSSKKDLQQMEKVY